MRRCTRSEFPMLIASFRCFLFGLAVGQRRHAHSKHRFFFFQRCVLNPVKSGAIYVRMCCCFRIEASLPSRSSKIRNSAQVRYLIWLRSYLKALNNLEAKYYNLHVWRFPRLSVSRPRFVEGWLCSLSNLKSIRSK